MLLQMVAFAADVADDLEAVAQPHLRDLAQRGVRLFRGRRVDAGADATLLRALSEGGNLALRDGGRTALAHQLIDGRHNQNPCSITRERRPAKRRSCGLQPHSRSLRRLRLAGALRFPPRLKTAVLVSPEK